MRRIAILVAMLLCAACERDSRDNAVLSCTLETRRTYPDASTLTTQSVANSETQKKALSYMGGCMRLASYEYDGSQELCTVYSSLFDPDCWAPKSALRRKLMAAEYTVSSVIQ